jgi:hypothetical protein
MIAFKLLGAILVLYVAYALNSRAIYARRGIWGTTYRRDADPARYWSTLAAYTALSIALLFLF